MVILEKIGTQNKFYPFIEQLLCTSFPKNERRDHDTQRLYTDIKNNFQCLLIKQADHTPIGVLTYWDFETFYYIEHLAIASNLRGHGWGSKTMRTFIINHPQKPVVLEVEHPTNEESIRRINFYKQCGLHLWECDYMQPPYRETDEWFPLFLMASDGLSFNKDYHHIRKCIHSSVYGIH